MRFADPRFFVYLYLIPLLVLVGWYFARKQKRSVQANFNSRLLSVLQANLSESRRRVKQILQLIVLVLFVFCLARPQWGMSQSTVKKTGLEIIIAFDVSSSMLTEDLKPSRLQFAKAEVGRLLDKLGGDKLGVVAFAGSAFLLTPLTTDKGALKIFLDSLSPESVSHQGTNIAEALREADLAFERGGLESDQNQRVAKVILVVSDGEDQEPGALDFAKQITQKGARIFTLAVGTEKGGPIPEYDERGSVRGYKRDATGQLVLSTLRPQFLQDLASYGGGKFYRANFAGDATSKLMQDLDKLEKAEFETQKQTDYDEKYQPFLLVAIALAMVELLIGERRSAARLWRGRFRAGAR